MWCVLWSDRCVCVCIHTHIYMYIYIYIYLREKLEDLQIQARENRMNGFWCSLEKVQPGNTHRDSPALLKTRFRRKLSLGRGIYPHRWAQHPEARSRRDRVKPAGVRFSKLRAAEKISGKVNVWEWDDNTWNWICGIQEREGASRMPQTVENPPAMQETRV